MFRLTRILSVIKPIFQLANSAARPSPLFQNNFMQFTTQNKHKVFNMITSGDAEANIDKIVIELGTMSDKNREEALKSIVAQFYEGGLSPKIVVHPKLNVHFKKFPSIHFDAYHFRIVQSLTELMIFMQQKNDKASKIVVKDINDSFLVCFQAIKKITVDVAGPKEIELYKLFGHYHFHYLAELVEASKVKTCITKSKDFFKASLTKATTLIKTLYEKKIKLGSEEIKESDPKEVQEKRLREITSNQILLDDLIEGYGQVIFELIVINTQAAQGNKAVNKQPQIEEDKEDLQQSTQFSKQVLEMQPMIEKAVKNYQLSEDSKVNSKHYHKLKKTLIDIRFQKKNQQVETTSKSQDEKQKLLKDNQSEFINNTEELYKQTLQDFNKIDKQTTEIDDIVEFTSFLVSLKQNPAAIKGQKSGEQIYEQLGEECRHITGLIENDKIRQMVVVGLIDEIKSLFGVDISTFLQKIPRSFKYSRKGRRADRVV